MIRKTPELGSVIHQSVSVRIITFSFAQQSILRVIIIFNLEFQPGALCAVAEFAKVAKQQTVGSWPQYEKGVSFVRI